MTNDRLKYHREYREKNRERLRAYNREWMQNFRNKNRQPVKKFFTASLKKVGDVFKLFWFTEANHGVFQGADKTDVINQIHTIK